MRYYRHGGGFSFMRRGGLAWTCLLVALVLAVALQQMVGAVSTRLEERGLKMQSAVPGRVNDYQLSWRFMSPQPVGSVDLLFCTNPIPYMPCYTPAGMDVSGATLTQQSGETGFSISTVSTNHIVLSRTSGTISPGDMSSYTFEGIKNPTNVESFAIRLQVYDLPGATGQKGDFGSVRGSVTHEVTIETQVPPMLIFCLAREVELQCTGSDNIYYTDMGELKDSKTLAAQSQMAVGTNASAGFAITVDGQPPAAGSNAIDNMPQLAASQIGKNQFGINLVGNSEPNVGHNPEGVWANGQPTAGYGTVNRYKFVSGDVVASSPNVSLMRKFTVSYILNVRADLKPGIYATTITFIASGRF